MAINREATIRWKGYDPNDLKPKSHKKVWTTCDECGRGRWILFFQCHDNHLCISCANKKVGNDEERVKKLKEIAKKMWARPDYREAHMGKNNHMFGKDGWSKGHTKETHPSLFVTSTKKSGENHHFYGKHLSEETRKKISCALQGITLDKFNGFVASQNTVFWRSKEYQKWRLSVFQRDHFTCQECGDSSSGNLNAHHILPARDWKDSKHIFNIMNGITLCEECHKEVYREEYKFFAKYFDIANGIVKPEWKTLTL